VARHCYPDAEAPGELEFEASLLRPIAASSDQKVSRNRFGVFVREYLRLHKVGWVAALAIYRTPRHGLNLLHKTLLH
jgi:hypothetical protein